MRRATLGVIGPYTRHGHCTGERSLSFGVRTWCDVPAAAYQRQNQLAFARHARARHCARCLSGGGAARELAAGARRAVVVVVGPCRIKGHCADERPLSFGALPWCDVPAVATPRTSRHSRGTRGHAGAPLHSLSLRRHSTALETAARARRATLIVVGLCIMKGHWTGKRPPSFGVRPWCDVPAVTSHNQLAFVWHARARHCARCLSAEGAARE